MKRKAFIQSFPPVLAPVKYVRRHSAQSRAIVGDILVAAVWGATIPVLMWLGAAVGF